MHDGWKDEEGDLVWSGSGSTILIWLNNGRSHVVSLNYPRKPLVLPLSGSRLYNDNEIRIPIDDKPMEKNIRMASLLRCCSSTVFMFLVAVQVIH